MARAPPFWFRWRLFGPSPKHSGLAAAFFFPFFIGKARLWLAERAKFFGGVTGELGIPPIKRGKNEKKEVFLALGGRCFWRARCTNTPPNSTGNCKCLPGLKSSLLARASSTRAGCITLRVTMVRSSAPASRVRASSESITANKIGEEKQMTSFLALGFKGGAGGEESRRWVALRREPWTDLRQSICRRWCARR
jgi:hypothetical protein